MNKFKIGEIVKVKEDLVGDSYYGGLYFSDGMRRYKGKKMTVEEIQRDGCYVLSQAKGWCFNDEMLEGSSLDTMEMLKAIKPGDIYENINECEKVQLVQMYEDGNLHFEFSVPVFEVGILKDAKWRKKLVLVQTRIVGVKHKPGAEKKIYDFVSDDDKIREGDFVICSTIKGRTYGKVEYVQDREMEESELEKYKECWRER